MEFEYDKAEMEERFELAYERIAGIPQEHILDDNFQSYFSFVSDFLMFMKETYRFVESGELRTVSLEKLQEHNHKLYEDILPEHYEQSYANPTYAVKQLGQEHGAMLAFLYTELRALIAYAYESRLMETVIRLELFLEIYGLFLCEKEEGGTLPAPESVRRTLYWFFSDYSELAADEVVAAQIDADRDFAVRIIMESDLSDLRYLYYFGEYISEHELRQARHLLSMSQEQIDRMAQTYTEGYRKGFELAGKPLHKKKTVCVYYRIGFERMIRKAIQNFENLGLRTTMFRAAVSAFQNKSVDKVGYYGATVNKQYDYDHREDKALFFDAKYCSRRLEVLHAAYEARKQQAAEYAGPAVVETFGEIPYEPQDKKESLKLDEAQQKLQVKFQMQSGMLMREYINYEERSFTIIAFPTPHIGELYEEIFEEIVRINTLDYDEYSRIQKKIIDVLDKSEYCVIKGMNGNRTNLRVELCKLKDPSKETKFENCVADVNIPVGEVFTTPVLKGTDGVLHVSHVFLSALEYKNLELTFRDGKIVDYSCSNFDDEKKNRNYVEENLLFHHETLPMGEFAIGTNTTAYVMAKKYDISGILPILIAEKTGPHFAVGDTCYPHQEEVDVYNPDGKCIVARDNEISLLRKTDPSQAYFNCHTDITIPFEELGAITAVTADGIEYPIIEKGRFVVEGCEALNVPLESAFA